MNANPPRNREPSLKAAAGEFEIVPEPDTLTDARNGERAIEIVGGLKTVVTLLNDGAEQLCLITTHFGPSIPINVSKLFRETLARDLDIPVSRVLIFTSHNHTSVALASNGVLAYKTYFTPAPEPDLLPVGIDFLEKLRQVTRELVGSLEPVTVWWAKAEERRISYNRKGRREDGSTYFIREEDRLQLGDDYQGDIDGQAPIVVLRRQDGRAVVGLMQFTAHPVTAFHPESTIVFGEWPQLACDQIAEELGAPVGFLQGCAADVNSKEMFTGGVERSREFAQMLGNSVQAVLSELKSSRRDGLDVSMESVDVPLASLPPREALEGELREIDDFIERAKEGDEDTLSCVGQNFAVALSPRFRAWLAGLVRPWTVWALGLYDSGEEKTTAESLALEIASLRIGDVGIVGLPCEPFQNIGRRIRARSQLSLTIPCGYMNTNHGYITDSESTGDTEYMSANYRYTEFRPPLQKPAGDVLADAGAERLNQMWSDED